MRQFRIGFLLMLLVTAAPDTVRAQATTTVQTMTVPFVVDTFNPCNGEAITLAGDLIVTIRTTVDDQGNSHRTFTLVPSQIRGEGESGTAYMIVGGNHEHVNLLEGSQDVSSFTSMFNVVSVGGTDNVVATALVHLTVTSDGTERVSFFNFSDECHG